LILSGAPVIVPPSGLPLVLLLRVLRRRVRWVRREPRWWSRWRWLRLTPPV
jgi:hypothetical protein